jgi:K+-transporting ATPase ATPase A chain
MSAASSFFMPSAPAGGIAVQSSGKSAVAPDLSFNTAISFITNTNWQN